MADQVGKQLHGVHACGRYRAAGSMQGRSRQQQQQGSVSLGGMC